MAAKEVVLDGVGKIKIYKRKGARSLRLSVVGDGTVRVTQPRWLPYKAGLEFAYARKKWIIKNLKPPKLLEDGQVIGKSFRLEFRSKPDCKTPIARLHQNRVLVTVPQAMGLNEPKAQSAALRGVERALKLDAEELLIPRLQELAMSRGFEYRSVSVKKLKSRWGSCSSNKDITLSSYLVQLPWDLIDYVILHELQHTTILAHGKKFWDALDHHVDNLAHSRKAIKEFQARIL